MTCPLQINAADLPSCWKEDNRMNVLFSIFRSQSVNLVGWHDKMNFWTSLIQEMCLKNQAPVINLSTLNCAFERKGRQPQCLDIVLEHMASQATIMSMDQFKVVEHEKGWLNWGFDVLVKKPVVWGFSSVQNMLNWSKKDDRFVVLSVIEDLAAKVYQRHLELTSGDANEKVTFLECFEEQCKDICTGENFCLAIIQLQREKKIFIFEEDGRKILKLKNKENDKILPLTELDKGILRLQKAKDSISKEIDKMDEEIQSCIQEAKQMVKIGSRSKAMVALKRKKRLELNLKKKMVEADNIDSMLDQLQKTGTDKMVLDAYKAGVEAMKWTSQDELDLDKIDTTMSEMEEVMDNLAEIQATLSKPMLQDDSLQDFEDELKGLLLEDEEEEKTNLETSADADLLRRLEALKSSSPLPSPEAPKARERHLLGDEAS